MFRWVAKSRWGYSGCATEVSCHVLEKFCVWMCIKDVCFDVVTDWLIFSTSHLPCSFPVSYTPILWHSLSSSSFRLSLSLSPSPLDARTFVYFYKLACPYFYPWSIVCSAKPEIYTFCQTCTCERALAINAIEYVHGSWGEATNSAERFIMYKDGMYIMSWSCGTMIQGTFR